MEELTKTKSFQAYLEKRLDETEVSEIEQQAKLEMEFLTASDN